MGIRRDVYRSNGYRSPKTLYNDILLKNPISTNIVPNNISTTSKMYTKVLNFQHSTDIFWKNTSALTINFNPTLSHTHLKNVDLLLTNIDTGYILPNQDTELLRYVFALRFIFQITSSKGVYI